MSPIMKPHVICHMMSPLDGRLKVAQWTPSTGGTFQRFVDEYERIHDELGGDAWLVGRATGEEFADGAANPQPPGRTATRPAYEAPRGSGTFAVILDTHGALAWRKSDVNGDHVIVVTGAEISDDYLVELAEAGVSYVVSSGARPDPAEVLHVLARRFGIRRLLLEGGAKTNGSFFEAGMVDEISYVLFPAIGGRTGSAAIFEAGEDGLADLVRLKLESFTPVGCEAIHARYSVSYTR